MPVTPTPPPDPKPAPNPFTTKEPQTGATEPAVPAFTPGPNEASPADRQKRKLLIIALCGVGFILLFGIVPAIILLSRPRKTSSSPTPTPTLAAKPSVDPNALVTLGPDKVFLKKTSTTNVAYDISIKVPEAWRGRFGTTPTKAYPWEDSVLITALPSNYSGLSSSNPNAPSDNYFAVIDVTDWIKSSRNIITLSPAQKLQWYTKLVAVSGPKADTLTEGIINPRLAAEPGGRQHLKTLELANAGLHGISYITMRSDKSYAPEIVTMVAGTYEGRSLVLFGQHQLRDAKWTEISGLRGRSDSSAGEVETAAINDFKAGKPSEDSVAMHDELLKTLNSLGFTKSSGQ